MQFLPVNSEAVDTPSEAGADAAPPPAADLSFGSLLAALQMADDMLTTDMDPAAIVGELRDRVDAIKFVVDRLEAFAAFMDLQAKPLLRAKRAAENNRERLREYCAFHMKEQNFQEVPGQANRIVLHDSQPSLEIKRQPTAEDYLRYPQFVTLTRAYSWKSADVKAALISGALKPEDCDFAAVTRGRYVQFYPAKALDKPKKPRGKKKEIEAG